MFSASIPVEHVEEANSALAAQGMGPDSFTIPMMPDADGATHVGLHHWSDTDGLRVAVEALPAEYGVLVRDTEQDATPQFTALSTFIGIPWPPDPDWMESLPMIGDEREFDGVLWRSTMYGNPYLPPYGWEMVSPPTEPQVWSETGFYQKPATVTGAAGTPGEGRFWELQTDTETAGAGREPWQSYMWAVWEEVT
jgi:hypothetical protein